MDFSALIRHHFRHLFHPQRSNNHRSKVLHPEGLFFLSLCLGGLWILLQGLASVGPLERVLGYASDISPAQVLDVTNQERMRRGLEPLQVSPELTQAALSKARHMFAEQYWAHVSPDGTEPWDFIEASGYQYWVAGENLARDFNHSTVMHQAWMDSVTHRANILSPKYSEIGIAVVDGRLQNHETTLVVQLFGSPQFPSSASQIGSGSEVERQVVTGEEQLTTKLPSHDRGLSVLPSNNAASSQASVLSSVSFPQELEPSGTLSPLLLSKAFILVVLLLVLATLLYDFFVIGHRAAQRLVAQNSAHLFLFSLVLFLVLFFKGGVIG